MILNLIYVSWYFGCKGRAFGGAVQYLKMRVLWRKRGIMTDAKVGEILQKMAQKFLISEIFYIFAL